MAIKKNKKPTIDISGPAGNAFALMGTAKTLGRQPGFSKEKIDSVLSEMTSGDYDNLLNVFNDNFGEYVDLVY